MARIPTTISMGAPRTTAPTPRPVDFGDLGLGRLAQTLDRVGRGMAEAEAHEDELAARGAVNQLSGAWAETYRPEAEVYDGRDPGFARAQIAKFDALADQVRQTVPERARGRFEAYLTEGRTRAFDQAVAVETNAAGARARAARDRGLRLQAIGALGQFRVDYAAAKDELMAGFDGSEPGFADKVLSQFDTLSEAALQGADEDVRAILEVQIASARADEWAVLQGVEVKAREAWEVKTALGASDALTNAVLSDPGQYDAALRSVDGLVAELPAGLGEKYGEELREKLVSARFQGLVMRGDWQRAQADLDGGAWDGLLSPETKAALLRNVRGEQERQKREAESEAKALAAVTVDDQIEAHIASIAHTGEGVPGLPEQVAKLGGPVAVAKLQERERTARQVFQATDGMAGLPGKDIEGRLEAMKPQAGDPDFQDKQSAFELATQAAARAVQLRDTDPAAAVQQAPENAALWRAFSDSRSPAAAEAYARDALRRQDRLGVAVGARRILSNGSAKALVNLVEGAEPGGRAKAIESVSAYVSLFGPYSGQVLRELQKAGLDGADAGVLALASDDPVAVGAYARGRERGVTVKLQPKDEKAMREKILQGLKPLLLSMTGSPGSEQLQIGAMEAVETAARGYMANGDPMGKAVEKAVKPYTSRYVYKDDWRMPAAVAAKPVEVVVLREDSDRSMRRAYMAPNVNGADRGRLANPEKLAATTAAEIGAWRSKRDLLLDRGALYPAGADKHLTDDQKRARYADMVAARGRWITTADDSGLMLVLEVRTGEYAPVLDAKGKRVVRTWSQLYERARKP